MPYTILEINIRTPNHHYSSQTTKTNSKMKEDQQTMTKYLPFKTNRRSVAQTVFIWQCFEEKLLFYQNHILRFSVQIFKGQPMLKVLLNLNGLPQIILLGLIRSHFLLIFWLLKKLKAAVNHMALKSSYTSNDDCRREEKSRKCCSLFTKLLFSVTAILFIF